MPKRGNLRKKTDEDEGEDAGAGAEEAPAIVIPPEKTKSKKKGKGKADGGMAASLLSFDDEEAGADTFQVTKKPPAGDGAHRVKKKSMRAPDALKPDAEEKKGGGEYSIERLRELASAQKTLTARPAEHMDHNAPANGRAARARANRSRSCPRHRALAATTISASPTRQPSRLQRPSAKRPAPRSRPRLITSPSRVPRSTLTWMRASTPRGRTSSFARR